MPTGCDLQAVPDMQESDWEKMLGEDGSRLAEATAAIAGEDRALAATRVWSAREAIKKAGLPAGAPLTVDPQSTARWVVFRSGDTVVFSSSVDAGDERRALCLAVALKPRPAASGHPASPGLFTATASA